MGHPAVLSDAYAIDADSGALKLVNVVPVPQIPDCIAVAPKGDYAYVVGPGTDRIAAYAIDPGSGALTAGLTSRLQGGSGAYVIAIEPSGHFAYTGGEGGQKMGAYSIGDNGLLTALPNFPAASAVGTLQIAIDPSGTFLYFPQSGSLNTVSGFRMDASSGTLTGVSGSPFAAGSQPMEVVVTRK